MNSLEISRFLADDQGFNGILAMDELYKIQHVGCYIINFDNKSEAGSHWISIAISNDCPDLLYFDSYGIAPNSKITAVAKKFGKRVTYSDDQLQSLRATTCGMFAIYFCEWMCSNNISIQSFKQFINLFYPPCGV